MVTGSYEISMISLVKPCENKMLKYSCIESRDENYTYCCIECNLPVLKKGEFINSNGKIGNNPHGYFDCFSSIEVANMIELSKRERVFAKEYDCGEINDRQPHYKTLCDISRNY